jgi:hypothetical protein
MKKTNKERRRSIDATPTPPSNKEQQPAPLEDHKKTGKGTRQSTDMIITLIIHKRK